MMRRAVYSVSAPMRRSLDQEFLTLGFSSKTVSDGMAKMRVISGLYPVKVLDWRAPFLFFARRNRVSGITLGHHVFLNDERDLHNRVLIAHEAVHVLQVQERGLIPFLVRYGFEWFRLRLKGYSFDQAYLALSDEVQARSIEKHAALFRKSTEPWLLLSDSLSATRGHS